MNQLNDKDRVVSVEWLRGTVKELAMTDDGRRFTVGWNAALNVLLKHVEVLAKLPETAPGATCPHWIGGVCELDEEEEGRYV